MSSLTIALMAIAALVCIICATLALWYSIKTAAKRRRRYGRKIRSFYDICSICEPAVWVGIGALVAGALLSVAVIVNDADTRLAGQLNTWLTVDSSKDNAPNNKSISFVASIQNPSNNPVSIDHVYVELDNGKTIELSEVSSDPSENSSYIRNAKTIGLPVGAHEAIRISLALDESDSTELIGSSLADCYVVDTLGVKHKIDIKPVMFAATDTVVNRFSLASPE